MEKVRAFAYEGEDIIFAGDCNASPYESGGIVIDALAKNNFPSVYNEVFGKSAFTTLKQRLGEEKIEQRFIDHICYRTGGTLCPLYLLDLPIGIGCIPTEGFPSDHTPSVVDFWFVRRVEPSADTEDEDEDVYTEKESGDSTMRQKLLDDGESSSNEVAVNCTKTEVSRQLWSGFFLRRSWTRIRTGQLQ
jgi:hypothetical protein